MGLRLYFLRKIPVGLCAVGIGLAVSKPWDVGTFFGNWIDRAGCSGDIFPDLIVGDRFYDAGIRRTHRLF